MTTLTLDHVTKVFGRTAVIEDVSVTVEPGKVHVLLGENGAGKSTLIKMMCGIHAPDAGRILVDGREVTIPDARAARHLGIATIHQELNLVPSLSVAENISLGEWPSRGGVVSRAPMRERARAALDRVGLAVPVDRRVGDLGIAQQQLVEIAKALSQDADLLILDEPTAALTDHESEQLFTIMEDLRRRGVAMVFISHHLDEIARIGDVVTVLRDGRAVAEVSADVDEGDLVRLMVGRSIDDQFPRERTEPGEVLLDVAGLTRHGGFEDVSLQVRAGEVVGLAGLVGAGRTEVIRALAGADTYDSGTVTVKERPLPRGSVAAAIRNRVGMVPEDRKAQGLIPGASIADNLGLATLWPTARWGLADRTGQRRRARENADRLHIRMASLDQPVRELSGGNQQKVVFGRWTQAGADVLLLDEPTRGVDVGARVEIYDLINDVTARGGAVLMASSELPEVLGMSDRIVVMSGGRVSGEVPARGATQDQVMALAVRNVTEGEH
ncbi:sugar ABC transporter ATP-binding protein [Actinomyces provencensis]|uniref:sugar ABC transporter ATP-binding protein n=1 Tax=Actinomyces provencensis TaxID=1720198 RepID=UPI00096AA958|nr:sugar ABC transporter ATP-binding protein [Actinomyces provencensis]